MDNELRVSNLQAEMCFMGCLLQEPDNYVTYGNYIRSQYDFSSPVTKFFYDNLWLYYSNFSQTVNETKLNNFMSQDRVRLQEYRKYKGWKTAEDYMELADINDIDNYFKIVKKYSLLREYQKKGYSVDRIMNRKDFNSMSANDVYKYIRFSADKINTVINSGQEPVELADNTTKTIEGYLDRPAMGLKFPWGMYNEYFLGMREKKVIFEGLVSNSGKSRKLVMLGAYITLVEKEPFILLSNEMDEEDLRSCLITTVINNPEFQELHGVHRNKPEREIVLGIYHDEKGNELKRKVDEDGKYIESLEDFRKRVFATQEYQDIKKVTDWIDNNGATFMFKDIGDDYSIERVEFELTKAKMVHHINYYGYDTLKGYQTDDWSSVKQFATKLKEITKELDIFGMAVFQLTDSTVNMDIFELSSMNIATSKGIKHICDILTLGKLIEKNNYTKYKYYQTDGVWGEPCEERLDPNKNYLAVKIDKNRAGSKDKVILFEINLNYNTWKNVGWLDKR